MPKNSIADELNIFDYQSYEDIPAAKKTCINYHVNNGILLLVVNLIVVIVKPVFRGKQKDKCITVWIVITIYHISILTD